MTYGTISDAQTMAGDGGMILAGRYRIVRQLGQGGMGSVWLGEDTQLDNKPFAIKMLPSILVSNKRAYRQLKDEALVAMKLTHPNIVTLRAFEENNGNPFLVMDYIDGETLDDYLCEKGTGNGERGNGLSEEEVIRILRPIAAALDYAHGEGVMHRDVKPANVMIRKDGHPFILDFGIAREIQETLTRVTGKLSSGTLLYMSPEQLNGEMPKPAQDIYSFAAMVYECLKGEPPFVRGQIEHQILNVQPEPLDCGAGVTGTTGVSPVGNEERLHRSGGNGQDARCPSIAASVMAGLAKKPEERPKSCTSVLTGCSTLQAGDPPVGNPLGSVTSSGGAWKAFAMVAAVGLAAFGGWWWHRDKQPTVKAPPLPPVGDTSQAVDEGKDVTTVMNEAPRPEMVKVTNEVVEMKRDMVHEPLPQPPPAARTSQVERASTNTMQRPTPVPASGWTVVTNTVVFEGKDRPCMEITSPDKTSLRLMWCGDRTNGFWMGETEVTWKQWSSVMGNADEDVDMEGPSGDHPMVQVRYEDCRKFMEKLQKETGLAFSLPDTNSWQIACLAGSRTAYWWGDDCFEQAEGNFKAGESYSEGRSMKVKSYKPNEWGLFDMHGNVAEWCDGRSVAGGNYDSDASDCKASSFRMPTDDSYMSRSTGLRVFLKEEGR